MGKPSRVIIDLLLTRHGLSPAEAVMVGDRLDTDCLFANNAGIASCLVLTGAPCGRRRRRERQLHDGVPLAVCFERISSHALPRHYLRLAC